jgi:DNA-directed RNA polymerase beta' subunit
MSIHLPLALKSQSEAKALLISTNNWLSTATGETNISPSQDMILGSYFLTTENNNVKYLLSKILRTYRILKNNKNNLELNRNFLLSILHFNKRKPKI